MHRSGEGCQKETTVTLTGDYSIFPPNLLPRAYTYRLGACPGGCPISGEGSLSAQPDMIRYRSDPDQLPQQCGVLAATEPNAKPAPQHHCPCGTSISPVVLSPVLQNSLPGQTAGTDRQAAPHQKPTTAPQREEGAANPLPQPTGLVQLMLGCGLGRGCTSTAGSSCPQCRVRGEDKAEHRATTPTQTALCPVPAVRETHESKRL